MKLENICPLTTNSSSELYLFKNTSVEELQRIFDSFQDDKLLPRIKEINTLGEAVSEFYDNYSDIDYIEFLITDAFKDSNNKGFVIVYEGNNKATHYQHWSKEWATENELAVEKEILHFQEFLEDHLVAQQHLG